MTAARLREASAVRPSPRQLAWQRLELLGFVHVGMNTMTDREWGDGTEDPARFAPDSLDADQWARSFAEAGARGLILTAKHHDGFCLWPTATTGHSVAASPWREGRGDLVAEVAAACARHGLRFGVYLSPWDRNHPAYGSGTPYDDVYVAQLTELLTGYGPVFDVWLDGANGEGPDGRVQQYDWARYTAVVRALQPDAVMSICGPDVRWCGNEAGAVRPDEWSVVPASLRDAERTASHSQRSADAAAVRLPRSDDRDLGGRDVVLATTEPLVWYPAEVDVSLRPGWFHHPAEDDAVLTADALFDLWRRSVGGNAVLLLNAPPTRRGLLHDRDVAALEGLGRRVAAFHARDRTGSATSATSSGTVRGDGWAPDARDERPRLELRWPEPVLLEALLLEEDVALGQQIDRVEVEIGATGSPLGPAAAASSVGHRRILPLPARPVDRLVVTVPLARGPYRLRVRAIGRGD